jgi:UDP-N-acetylmuramyl pentapeptide phosphotransferase/UDP-N-acetylglucosamine-1-phosphate transferase
MIEFNITTAFLTSLILLIMLRPLALKFDLVDYPDEKKTHVGNIPVVEGMGCVNRNSYRKKLSSPKFPSFHNIIFVLLI